MSSPWLKKNPLMSMWLSGAHRVAGTVRGQATAQAKRQAAAASVQVGNEVLKYWLGAAAAALPKAKPKRRR